MAVYQLKKAAAVVSWTIETVRAEIRIIPVIRGEESANVTHDVGKIAISVPANLFTSDDRDRRRRFQGVLLVLGGGKYGTHPDSKQIVNREVEKIDVGFAVVAHRLGLGF